MKKIISIILGIILIATFSGCNDVELDNDGFFTTDQTVNGGDAVEELNLTKISVENNKFIEIVFSFAQGSELAGQQQSAITKVPDYYVSFCENPTRLVLGIKNLKYWDYQQNIEINDSSNLVQGFFKVLQAGSRSYSQIYINLSSSVVYRVEEQAGSIKILLKKEEANQTKEKYFVYGNLASEYYDGALEEDAGFTPTLTNDFSAVVMISRAFDTLEEAENFKAEIEDRYSYLLATKKLSIFSSNKENSLPSYIDSGVAGELNNNLLINKNGISESLNVFLADARPLAISSNGEKAIFGRKEINGEYESEIMFVVKNDGTITKLTEYETTSVVMAMFSPDDKMFFYVEQIDGAMLASIYNFNTGSLKSIDEELIGTFISGAAWANDSQYIYFLSSEDMLSLKKYDVQNGSVNVINDENLIESELYCANNRLYYYSVDDEYGAIVSTDVSGKNHEVLTVGEYFSMDKQGANLIIKKPTSSQEGADTLTIYDLKQKKEKTIVENIILGQYFFSLDGTKVYYTVDNSNDTVFTQILYCYDVNSGNSAEIFKSKKAEFGVSFLQDELLMQVGYDKDGVEYPVTYKVSIK